MKKSPKHRNVNSDLVGRDYKGVIQEFVAVFYSIITKGFDYVEQGLIHYQKNFILREYLSFLFYI